MGATIGANNNIDRKKRVMSEKQADMPFIIKGGMEPMTLLLLQQHDIEAITTQLAATVSQAPEMFQQTPVILDLAKLDQGVDLDIGKLLSLLKAHGMVPVAIRNGNKEQNRCAVTAGIGILERRVSQRSSQNVAKEADVVVETAAQPEVVTEEVASPSATPEPSPPAVPATVSHAKIVQRPVHSGQQIYADGGRDLIILGNVSPGAEVLADGCIHIYGTLRGRALAGVKGDEQARIFCLMNKAELISIAGIYQVFEEPTKKDQTTQIYLQDGKLVIDDLQC